MADKRSPLLEIVGGILWAGGKFAGWVFRGIGSLASRSADRIKGRGKRNLTRRLDQQKLSAFVIILLIFWVVLWFAPQSNTMAFGVGYAFGLATPFFIFRYE